VVVDLNGDELNVPDTTLLEELDNSRVDHENGERGPAIVQRVAVKVDGNAGNTFQFKPVSLLELPGVDFLPPHSDRKAQMPARKRLPVVHQLKISRHALLER